MFAKRPKTRADYLLILTLGSLALVLLATGVYLMVSTDIAVWDAREHPETARFQQLDTPVASFLRGLKSYQSVDTANGVIQAEGLTPEFSVSKTLPSAEYPQRDLQKLHVELFDYCGTQGALELRFFNDRLMEAYFTMDAGAEICVAEFEAAYPDLIWDGNGRTETIIDHLRIASNLRLVNTEIGRQIRPQPFIVWQDQRLMAQLQDWENRFAVSARLSAR